MCDAFLEFVCSDYGEGKEVKGIEEALGCFGNEQ